MRGRYEMLRLNLNTFLSHPGKRFPLDLCSKGEPTTGLFEDLVFHKALEVSGDAFCQLSALYLSVRIRTTVEQPCRRCLSLVRSTVDCYEAFTLPLRATEDAVDLTPRIVEFITATLDPRPLCRENCRGLCPRCGIDLNEHPDHTCREEENGHQRLGDFLRDE